VWAIHSVEPKILAMAFLQISQISRIVLAIPFVRIVVTAHP
jgi:hypothetical protein